MRLILQTAALAVAMIAGSTSLASATDYWFGVVTIDNPTNETLTYQLRWGDGSWEHYTLVPGEYRWHSWSYDYANENSSPTPYIRFDEDMSEGLFVKEYGLQAYACQSHSPSGSKWYSFCIDYGRVTKELYSTN